MRSLSGPATYQQVSQATGLKSPKTCLSKLKRKGLVDNTGDNQWVLTTRGIKQLNEPEQQPPEKPPEKLVVTEEMPTTSGGSSEKSDRSSGLGMLKTKTALIQSYTMLGG